MLRTSASCILTAGGTRRIVPIRFGDEEVAAVSHGNAPAITDGQPTPIAGQSEYAGSQLAESPSIIQRGALSPVAEASQEGVDSLESRDT